MHRLDPLELAALHLAVVKFFKGKVPTWLLLKIDQRVALAWLCVSKGPLSNFHLVDDLYGIVSALQIYQNLP